jgi:hypothetical protein
MTHTSPIITSLDQRYIDVQFAVEAEDTGNLCGMLPPPDYLDGYSPDYEASQNVYSEARWPDLIAAIDDTGNWSEAYIREILAQLREPSCVYAATAQATQIIEAKQFGVDKARLLSWISGYRHNGSRSSGSSVPGAAVWMEGTGLQPRNDDPLVIADIAAGVYRHSHPATGYGVAQASGWKETAKNFRTHEWFRVTTIGAFVSALIDGWVILGGRDGHCVCHVRPLLDNGRIISMYVNSWSSTWGSTQTIANGVRTKGFGYDSKAKIQTMVSRGAWAIRSVVRPSWLSL